MYIFQLATYQNERNKLLYVSDEMTTVGDRVLNISLPKIGEKSLFTKDLEEALKNEVVDFVVHSLKDLPTTLPDNMTIGAVLEREDPRDALVLAKHHEGKCLKTLPAGSIIGILQFERFKLKDSHLFTFLNCRYIITPTHRTNIAFKYSSESTRHSRQSEHTFSQIRCRRFKICWHSFSARRSCTLGMAPEDKSDNRTE